MMGSKPDHRADDVPQPKTRMMGPAPDTDVPLAATPPERGLASPEMGATTKPDDSFRAHLGEGPPEAYSEAGVDALPERPPMAVPSPPSFLAAGMDAPLRLPCSFGDYELLEEIARGGMGVVYKARQEGLGRLVALKMILTGTRATSSQLERFAREARAAASLDHPNIVPVYDNGCHEGHPFFTMALIDGVSLERRVQRDGPPRPCESVRLLRAVVDALAYAHSQGIIHRDLKPQNVLIDGQGRARVTDFGLARRVQEGQGLTHPGEVLGTPSYMAPEQALGQLALLGPGVDIYGLGGILYFLLTGQPPFTGETAVAILCCVLDRPPRPPREIRSDVPPELEAICLKCLEKHPAHRYLSAASLGEALAGWEARQGPAEGPVTPASPPAAPEPRPIPRRRRGLLLGAAGVLGVGATLLALWLWIWGRPKPEGSPSTATVIMPELPRDMRHDFGLKVELLGGHEGPDGLRVFREDEPIHFRIQTERDAYVGIWTVGPDGTVIQLFPNVHEREHLVKANQPRLVPGNDSYSADATASPPGKAELVRIVASARQWEPFKGETIGPFLILRNGREELEKHLRSIRSIKLRPKAASERAAEEGVAKEAVAEEALPYQVLPR
jgi:tRNA A-37 threonylcarbamoyl transferase component Bud32